MARSGNIKASVNKITKLREERGLSSSEVAKLIGTSAPHMSRLENGKSPLTLDWLAKIAGVLKVNTNDIVDLPYEKKFLKSMEDDTLLGAIIGWIFEAADESKVSLSKKDVAKWSSFVFTEVVKDNLNFNQTKYLAFMIVKIINKMKG